MPAVFQLAEDDHAPPLELDTSRVPRATSSQPAPSRARRGRIGAWLGVIMVVLIGGALVAGVLLEGREGTSRPGASGVHTEIARVIAYSDLTEAQKRLFRKANRLILKERWAAATRILERLLERQPDFAEGHRQLGRCRLEQGFRTSAGDAYRRYLELDPHGRHVNQVQELLTTRGL